MTNKVLKVLGLGFLGTLIVSCIGISSVIYKDTLIDWWKPVALALIIALGSGKFMWKMWSKLIDTDKAWINYCIHVITATSILVGIFYIGNYFIGINDKVSYQEAIITRIYREQHYKTRRISRRVYGRGAPYWVYKADLELANGESKDLRITKKRYDVLSKGDTLGLAIRAGGFGVPVIDTDLIKYPKKSKKKSKKRHFGYRSKKIK